MLRQNTAAKGITENTAYSELRFCSSQWDQLWVFFLAKWMVVSAAVMSLFQPSLEHSSSSIWNFTSTALQQPANSNAQTYNSFLNCSAVTVSLVTPPFVGTPCLCFLSSCNIWTSKTWFMVTKCCYEVCFLMSCLNLHSKMSKAFKGNKIS